MGKFNFKNIKTIKEKFPIEKEIKLKNTTLAVFFRSTWLQLG
jgi:hypothetical protein